MGRKQAIAAAVAIAALAVIAGYFFLKPSEAVTLRVMGVVAAADVPARTLARSRKSPEAAGKVEVVWANEVVTARRYDRSSLRAGQRVRGPAVLVEYSSTGWVPPG